MYDLAEMSSETCLSCAPSYSRVFMGTIILICQERKLVDLNRFKLFFVISVIRRILPSGKTLRNTMIALYFVQENQAIKRWKLDEGRCRQVLEKDLAICEFVVESGDIKHSKDVNALLKGVVKDLNFELCSFSFEIFTDPLLLPGMHPKVLDVHFLEKFKTSMVMGNEPDKEILKMVGRTTLRIKCKDEKY
ncbi:hypothetical protein C5167_030592 [Papaver somniferum]|nr:hypothetical protein C5167_030592 [Papaver somniferum]